MDYHLQVPNPDFHLADPDRYSYPKTRSVTVASQERFGTPFIFYEFPELNIDTMEKWEVYLRTNPNLSLSCGRVMVRHSNFFEEARKAQKALKGWEKRRLDMFTRFDPAGFLFYKDRDTHGTQLETIRSLKLG